MVTLSNLFFRMVTSREWVTNTERVNGQPLPTELGRLLQQRTFNVWLIIRHINESNLNGRNDL